MIGGATISLGPLQTAIVREPFHLLPVFVGGFRGMFSALYYIPGVTTNSESALRTDAMIVI